MKEHPSHWLRRFLVALHNYRALARQARNAASNAVRDGRLVLPSNCAHCGSTSKLERHHENYDEPLHCVVLCGPCHRAHHRAIGPTSIVARMM